MSFMHESARNLFQKKELDVIDFVQFPVINQIKTQTYHYILKNVNVKKCRDAVNDIDRAS